MTLLRPRVAAFALLLYSVAAVAVAVVLAQAAPSAPSELAATLVSFALFQPIRRRVQDAVDRRFDRSRYDAAQIVEAFADQLRDEVDLDALNAELVSTVNRTMPPAHSSLWLRPR